jgi:hypothetical protein
MSQTTLEQVLEAVRSLPRDDRRRLYEWLQEQERKDLLEAEREEKLKRDLERFRKTREWLRENRAKYMGQWVALDGDRLISHGTDGLKVHAEAKAAGIETPLLEHIVEEKERFCGGWLP